MSAIYEVPETIRAGDAEIPVNDLSVFGDRVLLRELTADELGERKSALVLPDQSQDHQRLLQGVVVRTGPYVSANILPGLRVICSRFNRLPLDNEGRYWITNEDACMCVIEV